MILHCCLVVSLMDFNVISVNSFNTMSNLFYNHRKWIIISNNVASIVCTSDVFIMAPWQKKLQGICLFYSNVFVYNFKPGHLTVFWSLNSSKNTARLMENGMTRTDSNYEYDWR